MDVTILLNQELMKSLTEPQENETPMDTTAVYIPTRFCSSCCTEWGDVDLLLDLQTRRSGNVERNIVYKDLRILLKFRPCCTRGIFPSQKNVEHFTKTARVHGSRVLTQVPSNLYISDAVGRVRVAEKGPVDDIIEGGTTLDAVQNLLSEK